MRVAPSKSKPAQPVTWNAADYAANSAAQHAWARELIAKLELGGREHILDAGCGDGKVTAEIARALPCGSATGIDASPQMIEFARTAFPRSQCPNLEFHVMDARRIRFDRQFDLIFSNAALHWVDDHQAFLRGAAAGLRSGGRLIVSCGGRGNAQDVFVALRPELRLKRWRGFFRGMEKPYFFLFARRLRKMAAALWFQNAGRPTGAEGCDLCRAGWFCRLAAHHVAALCAAGAGGFTRGIHRRRHRPLSRQTSAGRGWKGSRPDGAAGN